MVHSSTDLPHADRQRSYMALEVRNLTRKYGRLTAVDHISFDIKRGEIFGILGPNGAGKTTTILMICGLLAPTAGQLTFAEQDIHPKDARCRIGYCPQENIYWDKLTCFEQLVLSGRLCDIPVKSVQERARELLDILGLEEKSGVLTSKLSGGMKRRLNIALALIHDPDIIILDEPAAGLDPQSRVRVRQVIRSVAERKTVILTTHNMDEADRLCHRVAIMDQGKLLRMDTPENLKKTIGEGDVLEITLQENDPDRLNRMVNTLKKTVHIVYAQQVSLWIRGKGILDQVTGIMDIIRESGFTVQSVTLRGNTLEDVFIHLTGRKLRI